MKKILFIILTLSLLLGCQHMVTTEKYNEQPVGTSWTTEDGGQTWTTTSGINKNYESKLETTDTKIHFTHPSYENIFMAKKSPVINDDGFIGAAGGGNWYTMALNSIKSIIGGILGWIWVIVIIGIIGTIVYFLVPAAKPIIDMILRFLASIIPFVGSLVERAVAKVKYVKPLTEVIDSGEKYKEMINADTTLTTDEKKKIIDIWKTANNTTQDTATQDIITEIKK